VRDRAGYRDHLRAVVAASAAPYGYTLTLWTAGAVTAHAEAGLPTAWDAVLLLAGAVVGFGAVGTYASGGFNGVLVPGTPGRVRVWGGMHLPSVGLSILLVASVNALLDGPVVWPLVGFTATTATCSSSASSSGSPRTASSSRMRLPGPTAAAAAD
jgi:hypothetical protein